MAEWARLTPRERARARLQFQEARQLSPRSGKHAGRPTRRCRPKSARRWPARAAPLAKAGARSAGRCIGRRPRPARRGAAEQADAVTPTVVQAKPGATTTLISKTAGRPRRTPGRLPKIAATPGFVDRSTLLPRRGPQARPIGAAQTPSSVPTPAAARRRRACAGAWPASSTKACCCSACVMIAGYLYSSLTQQRHALVGLHGLQALPVRRARRLLRLLLVARGQTLAMQTWHIRVVDAPRSAVDRRRARWPLPAQLAVVRAGAGAGLRFGAALARRDLRGRARRRAGLRRAGLAAPAPPVLARRRSAAPAS